MPLHRNGGRDPGRAVLEKPDHRGAEYRRSHLAAFVCRTQRLHHVVMRRPISPCKGICEALAVELRVTLSTPPGCSVQQPVQLRAHWIGQEREVDLVCVFVLDDAPREAT